MKIWRQQSKGKIVSILSLKSQNPFNFFRWADLYQLMSELPNVYGNSSFSPSLALTDRDQADYFGQVYVKPVAVFTNAQCYSACDMFAAHMQDSGAAVIFGQDPRTGAGGANVVSYNDFILSVLPYEFPPLPAGQDMTVSWRQAIRSHDRDGQLIEEVGVEPDFVVRPRLEDFMPNRKESSSFNRIAEKLKQIGRDTEREHMSCKD